MIISQILWGRWHGADGAGQTTWDWAAHGQWNMVGGTGSAALHGYYSFK